MLGVVVVKEVGRGKVVSVKGIRGGGCQGGRMVGSRG